MGPRFRVPDLLEASNLSCNPDAQGNCQLAITSGLVRSSEDESGTVTMSLIPSKVSAAPDLPEVVHVAPEIVPLLPVPESSWSVVPLPAPNP